MRLPAFVAVAATGKCRQVVQALKVELARSRGAIPELPPNQMGKTRVDWDLTTIH